MDEDRHNYRTRSMDYKSSPQMPPTTFAGSISQSVPESKPEPFSQPKAHSAKNKRNFKKPLLVVATMGILAAIGSGGFFYLNQPQPKPKQIAKTGVSAKFVLGESTQSQIKIPIYYPVNLPAGYTVNKDVKAIEQNVLYYSVTGPGGKKFYVTQQPIPQDFNFITFNNKFLKPDTFNSAAGTVTAGVVGTNLLGSIRTNKNSWIIINSEDPSDSALPQLETLARSFQPAE